jgi:hypothetical protein
MLFEMYRLALSGFTGCAYVGCWYVQRFHCAFSGFTGYACGLVFYVAFSGSSENRHSCAFRVYGVRLKVSFGTLSVYQVVIFGISTWD